MSMNGMLARRTNTAKKNRLSVYFISSKSRKKTKQKKDDENEKHALAERYGDIEPMKQHKAGAQHARKQDKNLNRASRDANEYTCIISRIYARIHIRTQNVVFYCTKGMQRSPFNQISNAEAKIKLKSEKLRKREHEEIKYETENNIA